MAAPAIYYTNNGYLDIFYILENGAKFQNGEGSSSIYFRAFNLTPECIWAIDNPPSGMTVSTGVGFPYLQLGGVPDSPGVYTFNVSVTTAEGTDTKPFTLRVGKLGGESDALFESIVNIYVEKRSTYFTSWLSASTSVIDVPNWGFDFANFPAPAYPFIAPVSSAILAPTYPVKSFIIHSNDAPLGDYVFPGFLWRPDGTSLHDIPFTIIIHLVDAASPPSTNEITVRVADQLLLIDAIYIGQILVSDYMLMADKISLNITYGATPTEEVFQSLEGEYYCPPAWINIVDA